MTIYEYGGLYALLFFSYIVYILFIWIERNIKCFKYNSIQKGMITMIKNKAIFKNSKITTKKGEEIRVLSTEHHITSDEIQSDLYIYSLVRKGNHYMVDSQNAKSTMDDFEATIISSKQLVLGDDVEYKAFAYAKRHVSVDEYYNDTVGKIKLFVIMPMHGVDDETLTKRLFAAREAVALVYGRDIDDVELIDQVHVIDPDERNIMFESETERRIYRLTRSMRMMANATHILDLCETLSIGTFNNRYPAGCCVEKELCNSYGLNLIHGNDVFNKLTVSMKSKHKEILENIADKNRLDYSTPQFGSFGNPSPLTPPFGFGDPSPLTPPAFGFPYPDSSFDEEF